MTERLEYVDDKGAEDSLALAPIPGILYHEGKITAEL